MQHSSNRSSARWLGPELLEALWTIFVRKLSMNDEVGVLAPNRITVDNEFLRVGHGTFQKVFYHCGGQRPELAGSAQPDASAPQETPE